MGKLQSKHSKARKRKWVQNLRSHPRNKGRDVTNPITKAENITAYPEVDVDTGENNTPQHTVKSKAESACLSPRRAKQIGHTHRQTSGDGATQLPEMNTNYTNRQSTRRVRPREGERINICRKGSTSAAFHSIECTFHGWMAYAKVDERPAGQIPAGSYTSSTHTCKTHRPTPASKLAGTYANSAPPRADT